MAERVESECGLTLLQQRGEESDVEVDEAAVCQPELLLGATEPVERQPTLGDAHLADELLLAALGEERCAERERARLPVGAQLPSWGGSVRRRRRRKRRRMATTTTTMEGRGAPPA